MKLLESTADRFLPIVLANGESGTALIADSFDPGLSCHLIVANSTNWSFTTSTFLIADNSIHEGVELQERQIHERRSRITVNHKPMRAIDA